MKLISTNPSQGYQPIGEIDISTEEEIVGKVAKAKAASIEWKKFSVEKRAEYFRNLITVYKRRGKEVAELQSTEMGKPISESLGDVEGDLSYIEDKITSALKYLQPQVVDLTPTQKNVVYFEPYGVAAVISPWNFPSGNFFISCTQLLLAGNTIVFKHSEECPLTGKLLADIMDEAGFPDGVFSEVYGDGKVGDFLTSQDVDIIHFTGSTKVGQYLYKKAADKFIPAILEMGGSSPGVIFDNANLIESCQLACDERFLDCGQVCCALKRLIVHESIFNEVVAMMKKIVSSLKVGNPLEEDTDIGPLVAKRQLDLVAEQVEDAKEKGATVEVGGSVVDGLDGAYYQPTVLTNVTMKMRVMTEEVFGPVLPIISFSSEEEAIKIANDTQYGLSAFLYGKDVDQLKRVALQIDAGQISINGASFFSPNSPFGGYKKSGLGRNDGLFGLYEVTQKKVIAEPIENK